MKIGIYGDSFADSYPSSSHIAWFNRLPDFIPGATVKSYGKGGSSVFYSYNQFTQTHLNFDLIIFLVTNPNRYTKYIMIDGEVVFPHSLREVEYLLKNKNISTSDYRLLEGLRSYFIDVVDEDYNTQMTELMMTHIESMNTNVLFFPCFPNSFLKSRLIKTYLLHNRITLFDILSNQKNMLRLDANVYYYENTNNIACHFTEEFNLGIAKLFATKIKDGVWNWEDIQNITLTGNRDFYYKTGKL